MTGESGPADRFNRARSLQPPELAASARAARAALRVRESNRRARDTASFGRPLEYDESGFPIPTSPPTFAERVRRLLVG
jgi:hypothetical protein